MSWRSSVADYERRRARVRRGVDKDLTMMSVFGHPRLTNVVVLRSQDTHPLGRKEGRSLWHEGRKDSEMATNVKPG